MSARKALAVHRAEFVNQIIPEPCRSRARELVQTGLMDLAAQVAGLAHDLTDKAMAPMSGACSERGIVLGDIDFVRRVTFDAIVHGILARLWKGGRV